MINDLYTDQFGQFIFVICSAVCDNYRTVMTVYATARHRLNHLLLSKSCCYCTLVILLVIKPIITTSAKIISTHLIVKRYFSFN